MPTRPSTTTPHPFKQSRLATFEHLAHVADRIAALGRELRVLEATTHREGDADEDAVDEAFARADDAALAAHAAVERLSRTVEEGSGRTPVAHARLQP